jgi:hypothetical protein
MRGAPRSSALDARWATVWTSSAIRSTSRQLSVFALGVVALGAMGWKVHSENQLLVAIGSIAQAQSGLSTAPNPFAIEDLSADFAQGLPVTVPFYQVIRELQRSSSGIAIELVNFSSDSRKATREKLGRVELTVTLRGAYPKLKAVLAETLDRFPQLIAHRLALRRAATPTDLEARVDLVLLSRPLPDARAIN